MLRLEMLSASVATPRWGTEARLMVHASSKHFINNVQPTQQAISLLTDLYPICYVDPAKQTFSVTCLQMFLSHRPIANNLQFGFILGRQGSAPEPRRIVLTVHISEGVLPGTHMRFLPQQNSSMGSSWEPMSHLKYSWLRFPKADKAVLQLMTFFLVT